MKNLSILIIAVMLLALILAGCSRPEITLNPDIRGKITAIDENQENVSILIEGPIQQDTGYDKARVTITADTEILLQQENQISKVDIAYLQQGQTVQAVFNGPVMESYPVQAQAEEIIILQP
ncbi:MAG: DUF3221 domain-containing protein [Actinomycetota bacterium]|nr:DUF3221 domain-containing protein [Actinomycetota bacterium]